MPEDLRLRAIRRRCAELQQEVAPPDPFDVGVFCGRLAHHRGRQIILQATPLIGAPGGLWFGGKRRDYVYYEQDTSRPHQEHIILHEVWHMLSGHVAAVSGDDTLRADAAGAPSEDIALLMLGSPTYTKEEEEDAELFATLFLEQIGPPPPVTCQINPEIALLLDRLEATLEQPGRATA